MGPRVYTEKVSRIQLEEYIGKVKKNVIEFTVVVYYIRQILDITASQQPSVKTTYSNETMAVLATRPTIYLYFICSMRVLLSWIAASI